MSNIINNNFKIFKLKLYKGDYWDVVLNKDIQNFIYQLSDSEINERAVCYINLEDINCITESGVKTLSNNVWGNAYSVGYGLDNIGYTGFDNGLIYFERDRVCNKEFVDLYQNSSYVLEENDIQFKMKFVTGCTKQYNYDYELFEEGVKLNGGFLQGFFYTQHNKYQVFPYVFNTGDVMCLDFTLRPQDGYINHNTTLNSRNPNNKGIFWYIGTRAENKWSLLYNKEDESTEEFFDEYIDDINDILCKDVKNICEHPSDECECVFDGDVFLDVEEEMDLSNITYKTNDNSLTIGVYEDYEDYNNPFILYNRTLDGFTVGNYNDGDSIRYVGIKNDFKGNLHLLMNRTATGHTIDSIEELKEVYDTKYDIYADLYQNALAFRITEDGKIGYRYLIKNCENENNYDIVEGYSKSGIIKNNEWNNVVVKIFFQNETMFFKFYVSGNLVFITKELPKLNLRELNDVYEKQEAVPFNMSLGGGTQGLCETILPDYMSNPNTKYPLEKYFAGTFVGDIKQFKVFLENLDYNIIERQNK